MTVKDVTEKVTNEIIRLKHLINTNVTIKIEDAVAFLESVRNDLSQISTEPEEDVEETV